MKLLILGDPHGYNKYKKSILQKAELILLTGDIGKSDIARKRCFENFERKKRGLPEKEYNSNQEKKAYMEIYDSTIKVIRNLSRFAPVYSLLGNVGTISDYEIKKQEQRIGIKLPYMRASMKKIKNFHLVRNSLRNINGLKIGFLEYFIDTCWVQKFKPGDYKKMLKQAKKETNKAKKILKWFGKNNLDILVCHQPPYGILDKVTGKYGAPKFYRGKHAGSKAILNYIKKEQPRYVFCGHIHEGKGKKKIGKTEIYNVGCCGNYVLLDIE